MATRWTTEQNGTHAEFIVENGVAHRRLFNPQRKKMLQHNQRVRASGTRMMDWGKQVAEVPECDLPMLRHFFGDALFNDQYGKWDRKIAREKFLKSPASDPYRVEERKRMIR